MKTTHNITAVEYITIQAQAVAAEGHISARLADLFFQLATVREARTVEGWDALVNAAKDADSTIAEAIEFAEP